MSLVLEKEGVKERTEPVPISIPINIKCDGGGERREVMRREKRSDEEREEK